MQRIIFIFILMGTFLIGKSQDQAQISVNPNGLAFQNGSQSIIIANTKSAMEIKQDIIRNLKISHQSRFLKIDSAKDVLIVSDFIPGYTKSDKFPENAYQLDLFYKIVVDIKDNKFRVHLPTITIASNQKYEYDGLNKRIQFSINMAIRGKREAGSNIEKQLFIFNEKDKLIEKITKERLEQDLSAIVRLIIDQSEAPNWD